MNFLREGLNQGLDRVRLAATDSAAFFRSVKSDVYRNVRSGFRDFVQNQGIRLASVNYF